MGSPNVPLRALDRTVCNDNDENDGYKQKKSDHSAAGVTHANISMVRDGDESFSPRGSMGR